TSMFMHGGWAHLLGNMLYLWIFADCVEDRFGPILFAAFYLAAGLAGGLAQSAANFESEVPMPGASGATRGVLRWYSVMFPRKEGRVLMLFRGMEMRAWFVPGFGGLTQFVPGFGALGGQGTMGGVAYVAHIGGFCAGIASGLLWRAIAKPAPPPNRSYL